MAQYHITIEGQGFLIDLSTYRRGSSAVFPFQTHQATQLVREAASIRAWTQADWRGGRGGEHWTRDPENRFRGGAGLDGLTEGLLQSGPSATVLTNWNPSPACTTLVGFVTYRSGLFWATAVSSTLYLYRAETEGVGASVYTRSDTAPGGMAAYKDGVYLGSGTSGALYRWDASSGVMATATTIASKTGIPVMAVATLGGTTSLLYLGVSLDTGGQVYSWDGTTATLLLTLELATPSCMFVFDGKLYVALSDTGGNGTLYSYDGTNWKLVLTTTENAIQSAAVFGQPRPGTDTPLVFLGSIRDNTIWRFDGRTLETVLVGQHPRGVGVRGLITSQGRLYAALEGSDAFRTLHASNDGQTWQELRPNGLTVAASNGLGIRALGTLNGELYTAEALSAGNTGAKLYRIAKGASAAYNPTGDLQSVRYDGGLPTVPKVWRKVAIAHVALVSGQSVTVDYRIDGAASWSSGGTNSTIGSTITAITLGNAVSGRELEYRLTLTTGGSAPVVVKGVQAEYQVQAAPHRTWELDLLLEGTANNPMITLDGAAEALTGASSSTGRLWPARATNGTVSFADLDDVTYRAYVISVEEQLLKGPHRDGYQFRAHIVLVEA